MNWDYKLEPTIDPRHERALRILEETKICDIEGIAKELGCEDPDEALDFLYEHYYWEECDD